MPLGVLGSYWSPENASSPTINGRAFDDKTGTDRARPARSERHWRNRSVRGLSACTLRCGFRDVSGVSESPSRRHRQRDRLGVAGGVFVAVALALAITITQQVIITAPHFKWQTVVFLILEVVEYILLALAAVRAIGVSNL